MKAFISQPMNGKAEKQIIEERQEIIKRLEDDGYEVIDTIFTENAPKNSDAGIYYLGKSIEAMAKADLVVFMKGWELARGCKIEYEVAKNYEKEILILE